MKFWSISFSIFWGGMGIMALFVDLPITVIVGACFLAMLYSLEEVF